MRESSPFRPWAIVPAKGFGRAKSRLAPALDAVERRTLACAMFERVLDACTACHELTGTLVATDGQDAARLAKRRGASVLYDRSPPSLLCAVVDNALAELRARNATHALVVMADLPLIGSRDLSELLARLRAHDLVVVPDPQRRGTSALGLHLNRGLRTWFGHSDSLWRHLQEAERLGLSSYVLRNPNIAFDLDSPSDLAQTHYETCDSRCLASAPCMRARSASWR